MKFKFIGDTPKRMYGDKILKNGDTVEYFGHIARKAEANPLLEVDHSLGSIGDVVEVEAEPLPDDKPKPKTRSKRPKSAKPTETEREATE